MMATEQEHQASQALDPLTMPLNGVRLIEASAGTGKTYTISTLYLRLLLGQTQDGEPLSVEQILVVTFTKAATQELRDRIRQRICDAHIAFVVGQSEDKILQGLLDNSTAHHEDAERLNNAIRQMDEAAIYTIHGFCQRMLKQNAFESGLLFDSEFITDERELKQQAVKDYWRKHFYSIDASLAEIINSYWSCPLGLLSEIDGWLSKPRIRFIPELGDVDIVSQHQENLQKIVTFKQQWCDAEIDFTEFIQQSDINKRSYSKKNLPNWLNQMDSFAHSETLNYQLPKCLEKFGQQVLLEKTPKGEAPRHPVFDLIDDLLLEDFSLREIILQQALVEVQHLLQEQKKQIATLAPDDLLSQLANALSTSNGELLANTIRQRFPVAMIDEFQDTDTLQYQIYQKIYANRKDACLLMIGDPKQAIYAFRGADIFTYIGARRELGYDNIYTLGTNYRSSAAMVAGVNALFEFASKPFIYEADIQFSAVGAAADENSDQLLVNNEVQDGLHFSCLLSDDEKAIGKQDYQQFFARHCAAEIFQLLNAAQQGAALIGDRAVEAKDIAVLVRDRHEAKRIKQALLHHHIPSVFISDDSVLQTSEAEDIYVILMACLEVRNERIIRSALATSLFGLSAMELDQLNHDEQLWEQLLSEFYQYHRCWQRQGVMAMLRQLLSRRQLAAKVLAKIDGERVLTNILHISELLQLASVELHGPQDLMRWFRDARLSTDRASSDEQQMRLESDQNLVRIVTIHRSKGLEYNVVYLPFAAGYREVSSAQFHDEKTGDLLVDMTRQPESVDNAERERLAEDLRLLYVALTRAVHRCVVGVCNIKYAGNAKGSALQHSAMGYLLLQGSNAEDCNDAYLLSQLERLQSFESNLHVEKLAADVPMLEGVLIASNDQRIELSVRQFSQHIESDWVVSSYSALSRSHGRSDGHDWLLAHVGYDEGRAGDQQKDKLEEKQELSIFTFPRGAQAGTFMHAIFEQISFPSAGGESLSRVVEKNLLHYGFDEQWQGVIEGMVEAVLDSCLESGTDPEKIKPFKLRDVSDNRRLVEMGFYLPLACLNASALNRLLQDYGYLSGQMLDFNQLQGMLKGFIDLIVEHQGQYFLLDYKSNHLGYASDDYQTPALQQAISEHRYDLQYLLYTVALHRYLKQRLANYSYESHFGGAYYLFLRGMDGSSESLGVFYDKPELALVTALDQLLAEGAS